MDSVVNFNNRILKFQYFCPKIQLRFEILLASLQTIDFIFIISMKNGHTIHAFKSWKFTILRLLYWILSILSWVYKKQLKKCNKMCDYISYVKCVITFPSHFHLNHVKNVHIQLSLKRLIFFYQEAIKDPSTNCPRSTFKFTDK